MDENREKMSDEKKKLRAEITIKRSEWRKRMTKSLDMLKAGKRTIFDPRYEKEDKEIEDLERELASLDYQYVNMR